MVYLLENLGFVINHPRSEHKPQTPLRTEFLGFVINSTQMEIRLPGEKIRKIRGEADKVLPSHRISALTLVHYWENECGNPGYPNGSTILQKPPSVPLRGPTGGAGVLIRDYTYRGDQTTGARVVERPLYTVELTEPDRPQCLPHNRDRCLNKGLGGSMQWSPDRGLMEPSGTPNVHQLLGAPSSSYCYKMLCQKLTIHLKMDSMSALTYINEHGGTISPHLNRLAKELWLWCMERNILLTAQHLPEVLNTIADDELRIVKDRSDWMLCPRVFYQITQRLGP